MTYEHKRTDELDFEDDCHMLEDEGWEIISVSQGMIYWKRKIHTGGQIKPLPDDWQITPTYPPTILPYETNPPYTTSPARPDIYVTFNATNTNAEEIAEKIREVVNKNG